MNVTNFANLFHQNSIFQQNRPAQPSANNVLNQMSEAMLSGQERAKDLKTRFDTLELSAKAADRGEDAEMEELPEDFLRYYLNVYTVNAHLSQRHEESLVEYRDQLSAFDQAIQGYQDMLDGKTALPDRMEREDVSRLLEAARAAREQFLQEGAAALNHLSENDPSQIGYMGKGYSAGTERQQDEFDTWIDASADDIYGEIDRALANAHKVTATFQDWAANIRAELKRRGCGTELRLEDQAAVDTEPAVRLSLFQDLYEDVWNTFRQRAIGTASEQE